MEAKALAIGVLEGLAPTLYYRFDIFRHRNSEPEIALLPKLCKKNAISIDIGANIGVYTNYMPRHSSGVVAFEPLPQMHKRLTKFFRSPGISIHAVALSDRDGECEIRLPRGNPPLATIDPNNTLMLAGNTKLEIHKVPMRRLDGYRFQNVGLIKVDVEGHEEAVLRGSIQTLADSHPNLIVEIEERHNHGSIGRVAAFLGGMGYRGYFFDAGKLHPIETFDPGRDQPIRNVRMSGRIGRYINNFIFFPEGFPHSLE